MTLLSTLLYLLNSIHHYGIVMTELYKNMDGQSGSDLHKNVQGYKVGMHNTWRSWLKIKGLRRLRTKVI